MGTMPRKRQSTKSRIVKAAWNLFYKNGYEQTTVEDIIYASKTSKGTFYHYFKGKEALLNSLSYLFDEKYEELTAVIDPNLSAYDKLLFLNHELFYMIETSVDIKLLALLYSSQLVTKDKKSLSDSKRFYFKWITEILEEGLEKGEFKNTSTAEELMAIYAMFERALLYDWSLFKGKYSLSQYSDKLLPHVLDTFVNGV
ncbi:transcriptional regulator, TetR family [[Clostridium] hylemonae DSM 15053]|uniref:Transcriptional regulator, TetR family n=2 Tax=[Clostridium] hylemonae TaxID=89153 RepID=C0C690_9FIRM|nr:transcriptional regulator, TetR family [[Clostridium] hylemonae DSM 15053]